METTKPLSQHLVENFRVRFIGMSDLKPYEPHAVNDHVSSHPCSLPLHTDFKDLFCSRTCPCVGGTLSCSGGKGRRIFFLVLSS